MKRCTACGTSLFAEPLFTIEDMPVAAQYLSCPEDATTKRGVTLKLCACTSCRLTQLDAEPVSYYRGVIRSGGYFETMDKSYCAQCDAWTPAFHLEGKKVLEAGCGQDEFFSILVIYPVKAYGIEHFHELVAKVREKGFTAVEEYPEREDQVFENRPFDAFTSFNLFEYQPDPAAYLHAIANDLTAGGTGLVTMPSFEYILEENGFYEFISGRLSYFVENSLSSLLNRCGFDALKEERMNRDTISVWIKKKARPDVSDFTEKQKNIARDITGPVDEAVARDRATIWGASHQGFSIAVSFGPSDEICYIIDSVSFKQGHIASSSHIPIVLPDAVAAGPAVCILIAAPGYTEEIATHICEKSPAGTKIWAL